MKITGFINCRHTPLIQRTVGEVFPPILIDVFPTPFLVPNQCVLLSHASLITDIKNTFGVKKNQADERIRVSNVHRLGIGDQLGH